MQPIRAPSRRLEYAVYRHLMSALDKVMKVANPVASALYRASGGRIGGAVRGTPVLLLTVAGRRSGTPHTVPVGFFEHDGGLLVVGSYNGSDVEPQWFKNLRAAKSATVQRGSSIERVTVRVAGRAERDRLWRDVVTRQGKGFEGYAAKTERVIPIAVLTPDKRS